MKRSSREGGWNRVSSAVHLQLSAVNPPDARSPGPVIGPGARVRPCDGTFPASGVGVVCLKVETGGRIERGYTIHRMVSMRPEGSGPPQLRMRIVIGLAAVIALLIAYLLVS